MVTLAFNFFSSFCFSICSFPLLIIVIIRVVVYSACFNHGVSDCCEDFYLIGNKQSYKRLFLNQFRFLFSFIFTFFIWFRKDEEKTMRINTKTKREKERGRRRREGNLVYFFVWVLRKKTDRAFELFILNEIMAKYFLNLLQ